MSEGRVYLVGAGPGDPELLTLKGLRLLRDADVVVYDRLIDRRLLAHCKQDAELVDVGKTPGMRGRAQSRISDLLAEKALDGKRVVRLKGGDPFVFGRGGEEAEALREAGVPFEISPGVTSAVAVPAYAGIPLTHRDYSSSFTVITGSPASNGSADRTDWSAVARSPGTLVVLMGWRRLEEVASALVSAGKAGSTPAAAVSWGTTAAQKSVLGRLDSIADEAKGAGLASPAVIVIGEVARLHDRLSWFEALPLFGRRIMVTRTRNRAGGLSARLSELGAYPIEIPTIAIRPLEDFAELDSCLRSLSEFDWIAFTSANAVRAVCDRIVETGGDMRALYGIGVAVIGQATFSELLKRGVKADLVPDSAASAGLASALVERGIGGSRILLPRTDIATTELPELLRSTGAIVREVDAYRTLIPTDSKDAARGAIGAGVDAVTFTSSSTVRNLVRLLDDDISALSDTIIACIGPVTAATAGRYGLKVDIVAKVAAVDRLAGALAEHFSGR